MSFALARQWHQMVARSFAPSQWFEEEDPPCGEARHHGGRDGRHGEKIMWVYRKYQEFWLVGYYSPDREWHQDSSHATRDEAAGRVHWPNGGSD